jgi:hypothetical protein
MRARPLDPDKIDVIITCMNCRTMLWRMKILSRAGNVPMGTEYLPMGKDIPAFSDKLTDCPKCGVQFYQIVKDSKGTGAEEHRYRLQDPITGGVFIA